MWITIVDILISIAIKVGDHLFSFIVAIVAAAQVEMIIQQFDPWWLYYPLLSITIQVDTVLDFIDFLSGYPILHKTIHFILVIFSDY